MAELTVLGSGSPFASARRVSSGYVVATDGGAHVVIDAGGGVFERIGRSEIAAADLDPILLTHLHIDHSGGLAPLIFSSVMEGRSAPTTIIGPAPRGREPGCARFVELLFGPDGAWRYLHSFDHFALEPIEAPSDPESSAATTVLERPGLTIRSVAVPHGMMPALAYRIDADGRSIVFSGDVQRYHEPLVALAADCDLLVHDLALPERDLPQSPLHAKPSEVGRVAEACGAGKLVATHIMPVLEDELDGALAHIRAGYDGEVIVAHDLATIEI